MVVDLTRRQFIALNASASIVALFPWLRNTGLNDAERRTLVQVARTLFVHDDAPDAPYIRAVARVDIRCANDPTLSRVIKNGINTLQWTCADTFAIASRQTRVRALTALKGTGFFQA